MKLRYTKGVTREEADRWWEGLDALARRSVCDRAGSSSPFPNRWWYWLPDERAVDICQQETR